jgi:hypothetical protein
MDTVVFIIIVLVSFNFLLKLTNHSFIGVVLTALAAALFTGLMWRVAIEQSQTQIADWLNNPSVMLDTSVVLTIDVAVQMAFCTLTAQRFWGNTLSKVNNALRILLLWIPGLLIFIALFCLLVKSIFAFPGSDFATVAWVLAIAELILIPLMTYAVKWLFPGRAFRLELLFMLNALVAILGVVATVNGKTTVRGVDTVDYRTFIGVFAIFVTGALIGLALYRRKQSHREKNQ